MHLFVTAQSARALSVFPGGHAKHQAEGAVKATQRGKSALNGNGQNAVLGIEQQIAGAIHFDRLHVGVKGKAHDLGEIS